MPFTNYTELRQEIIDYVQREDLDLKIDDFITLAEKEMFNNTIEPLQLKELETITTISTNTSNKLASLPSDYGSMRDARMLITNKRGYIEYRAPSEMRKSDLQGQPCFFTIIGGQIEFDRQPDAVYTMELQYYAEVPALTSAAPTNVVLTNHPEIYLYGAVYRAMIFARDQETAATFKADFINAIIGANKSDKLGRYGPAPVMRVEGSTP